jgi:hypothetical protein
MLVLVRKPCRRRSTAAASVITEYLALDRQRRGSRPLIVAFAGFAIGALCGGALGTVPRLESVEAATTFAVPALALTAIDVWRWLRLSRRLDRLRFDSQSVDS